ncbi:MAG: bifunctional methylenetetrahydrofolate dehydrogenase/methenyltetrahydrofolate cyclohydrolase FolD [bacterium]
MAVIMQGKDLSKQITEIIAEEVKSLELKPTLAVIKVGNDAASSVYVRNKKNTAEKIGFNSILIELDENTTQEELEAQVDKLNNDVTVNAILVQLPLPKHINSNEIIEQILPIKDVDGFHPLNSGKLLAGIEPYSVACTPLGIIKLLEHYHIEVSGKNAVVIGRSNIVGKPISVLLLERNATVTICHSRTKNLQETVKQADIVVSAIGNPKFITAEFIKEGAVVIDVGINRLADGKLAGDVDYSSLESKASYITPVPGGVGPMTIAMLMSNTLRLYKIQRGEK